MLRMTPPFSRFFVAVFALLILFYLYPIFDTVSGGHTAVLFYDKMFHKAFDTQHLDVHSHTESSNLEFKFSGDHSQDLILWHAFFRNIENQEGFLFFEMGADNGIGNSNTYYFEATKGWQGLLVEPWFPQCPRISEYRSVATKQTQLLCPKAVCVASGAVSYEGGGQGGTTVASSKGGVGCNTTAGLLWEAGYSSRSVVHFWSLDCEGCEDVALKTFPWQTTKVALLLIEFADHSCGQNHNFCRTLLRDHGMQRWTDHVFQTLDEVWYDPSFFDANGVKVDAYDARYAVVLTEVLKRQEFIKRAILNNRHQLRTEFQTKRKKLEKMGLATEKRDRDN